MDHDVHVTNHVHVLGLGFGVWGLGSGVCGLGSGVWAVRGLVSGVWGLGSGVGGHPAYDVIMSMSHGHDHVLDHVHVRDHVHDHVLGVGPCPCSVKIKPPERL